MNMSADPKHTPEPKNAAPLSIDGRPANPTLRYLMARLRDPEFGCPWDLQ
ncbi:hypothetical protein K3Z90_27145, partial [Pseudomonas aeruginosa]|nr:hypothetical protein [Pseudomonas aeruginosa]